MGQLKTSAERRLQEGSMFPMRSSFQGSSGATNATAAVRASRCFYGLNISKALRAEFRILSLRFRTTGGRFYCRIGARRAFRCQCLVRALVTVGADNIRMFAYGFGSAVHLLPLHRRAWKVRCAGNCDLQHGSVCIGKAPLEQVTPEHDLQWHPLRAAAPGACPGTVDNFTLQTQSGFRKAHERRSPVPAAMLRLW